MSIQISDGTGKNVSAKVDDENRLHVDALIRTAEAHANWHEGNSFTLNFSATPDGPDDCFFYFKNTGDYNVIFEGFSLKLAADEYIDVKLNDIGTPSGGTDITPVNLNTSSGKTMSATVQHGNNIINLSGGSVAYRVYHTSSTGSDYTNFEQDIIVTKNYTLTLYCQTGTTALAGYFDVNQHE